jgi:predicted DNA-binding transcriptional regulator AlpA
MDHDKNTAITESELARRAAVSTAVLRKWRREGTGPRFVRLGRCVRYLVADVDTWLRSWRSIVVTSRLEMASGDVLAVSIPTRFDRLLE